MKERSRTASLLFYACANLFPIRFVPNGKQPNADCNMERFEELITSPLPVLVDFYAEWCGPCKAMKPILEELKRMKGEQIRVAKVDIEKHKELASYYKIQSVPTLMLFHNGTLLWRHSGVMHPKELKEVIEKHT